MTIKVSYHSRLGAQYWRKRSLALCAWLVRTAALWFAVSFAILIMAIILRNMLGL